MRLTQMDTLLIRMLYLSAAGILMLTVLGMQSVASLLFSMTFILVILLWVLGAVRKIIFTDAVLILIVGLSLLCVIINACLEDTAIRFSYFKKYFMFICTLVYFQAAYKLHIDDRTENFLLNLNSVLAVFLGVYYCFHETEVYLMNGRVSNYLTFGFTNPNLLALFLMCIYTGELLQLYRSKGLAERLWHLLLAAVVCYFIWETASRNVMLTVVAETALYLLLFVTKKGFRLPKWFAFLNAVWPFLFAMVYVALIQNYWILDMFSFMASDGKQLDARLSIWLAALQHYAKSPVLGAYSQISRGTGMSQLHNTHVDILASYGPLVLILVCCLLYGMIRGEGDKDVKAETMARICFAGTIIMGMGEAALVSGGLGIYLFAGMYLLLCNKDREGSADHRLTGKSI